MRELHIQQAWGKKIFTRTENKREGRKKNLRTTLDIDRKFSIKRNFRHLNIHLSPRLLEKKREREREKRESEKENKKKSITSPKIASRPSCLLMMKIRRESDPYLHFFCTNFYFEKPKKKREEKRNLSKISLSRNIPM